jgi:hypothetical protein
MTCRATVTIPESYGRALREITGTPWYRRCDWITVTADDVVSPADSGPRIKRCTSHPSLDCDRLCLPDQSDFTAVGQTDAAATVGRHSRTTCGVQHQHPDVV